MELLKYSLILLLAIPVGVFGYYRSLVWIGENVKSEWFKAALILMAYVSVAFGWLFGTIILMDKTSVQEFWVPFGISGLLFTICALLAYRRFKIRLDAVGIHFS